MEEAGRRVWAQKAPLAGTLNEIDREREREREREFLHGMQEEEGDRDYRGRATTAIVLDQIEL
jgi:hypothetical protein